MSSKKHKQKRRREGVAKIVKWNHDALKTRCDEINLAEAKALMRPMTRALKRSVTGVGLAAPQIGKTKRMILIWPKRQGEPMVMVNPEIIQRSVETITAKEGCLSYPGMYVDIERHERVTVKYDEVGDFGMAKLVQRFAGFEARIVQHELDHLDGVCLVGDAWRAGR